MQNKKANLAAYRARQATRQAKKQDTHLATLQRIKAKIKSATIGNYLKWPKAQPGATIIFRRDGKLYSHNNETNETTHYTTQQVKQLLAHGKAILIEANQPF